MDCLAIIDVGGTSGNAASVLIKDQPQERKFALDGLSLESDAFGKGQVRGTLDGKRAIDYCLDLSRDE